MNIHIADEISTKLTDSKSGIPISEIIVNGIATGKYVSGAVLEAVVQCNKLYLLFLTDDIPFEEMLSVYLFDNQWHLLDSARIGGIYTTGSFSALKLSQPNLIYFHFIGNTNWCIEILSNPKFRFPLVISEPQGVYRDFGFSRHFLVHGYPY
jgi:hypothetical protein